ncbi:DUF3592 domain-containing protein [Streptomyces sp. NPDC017991]|uniref:DUF3592 domain-containing protein n=1 Tax=Streptomyces sp. NPDC017991 TaxID=3365026 RepID=UPI0037B15BDC
MYRMKSGGRAGGCFGGPSLLGCGGPSLLGCGPAVSWGTSLRASPASTDTATSLSPGDGVYVDTTYTLHSGFTGVSRMPVLSAVRSWDVCRAYLERFRQPGRPAGAPNVSQTAPTPTLEDLLSVRVGSSVAAPTGSLFGREPGRGEDMMTMGALACGTGALLAFAVAVRESWVLRRLRRRGTRTQGLVVANVRTHGSDGPMWVPVIAFIDQRGHRTEFSPRVRGSSARLTTGRQVPVAYLPHDPQTARVLTWRHTTGLVLSLFLAGSVSLGFAVWITLTG